ncbi:MAG: putative toxin-antitoxin system toxin component, PIN family [Caldilineaceae bacterium]|nr:putative toxin-antitoxin system toxin component, PIN family [Caldilineaceae bacterium]
MRVTLDTNQLVRALMRPPELATFVMAWASRRITVVCSPLLLAEYQRILDTPGIAELIYPELRRIFLSQLAAEMEMINPSHIPPVCRDPDDDKVIATAVFGLVDYLVTADEDLRAQPVVELLGHEGIQLTTIDELMLLL